MPARLSLGVVVLALLGIGGPHGPWQQTAYAVEGNREGVLKGTWCRQCNRLILVGETCPHTGGGGGRNGGDDPEARAAAREARAAARARSREIEEQNRQIEKRSREAGRRYEFGQACYKRGVRYEDAGNWAAAEKEFREGIPNLGGWAPCWHLAYVLEKQGKYEEAMNWYNEVISRTSSMVGQRDHLSAVQNSLGHCQFCLGQYDRAEASFRKSLELDRANATARSNLEITIQKKAEEARARVGKPHPQYPNVVWAEDGKVRAAFGYRFVSGDPAGEQDYRVALWPGLAAAPDGGVRVADGYRWVNLKDPKDVRLEPLPAGTPHREHPNVQWVGDGKNCKAAPGYTWVDPQAKGDLQVKPLPAGTPHPTIANVVWTGDGTHFRAAPGYRWVSDDPTGKQDFSVVKDEVQTARAPAEKASTPLVMARSQGSTDADVPKPLRNDRQIVEWLETKRRADEKYGELGRELKVINDKIARREGNLGELQVAITNKLNQMTAAKSQSDAAKVNIEERLRSLGVGRGGAGDSGGQAHPAGSAGGSTRADEQAFAIPPGSGEGFDTSGTRGGSLRFPVLTGRPQQASPDVEVPDSPRFREDKEIVKSLTEKRSADAEWAKFGRELRVISDKIARGEGNPAELQGAATSKLTQIAAAKLESETARAKIENRVRILTVKPLDLTEEPAQDRRGKPEPPPPTPPTPEVR